MSLRTHISSLFLLVFSLSFSQENLTAKAQLLKANEYYTSGNYLEAAKSFYNLYNLNKKSERYLYYAASSAINANDYKLALNYYLILREINYTGVEVEYLATNIKTKKEEIMTLAVRDSLVNIGEYKKPKQRKTASKVPEITKNIALIYIQLEDHEKALSAVREATKEDPKNIELALAEANVYYALGDISKFESKLKRLIKKDRTNDDLIYNLGVLSADKGHIKLAEKYYKKAIKINPNNANAYVNLSALILSKELPLIEEMNSLGISTKDDKRYSKLLKQRKEIHNTAIPYLERALQLDPENKDLYSTLINIYEALGQKTKAEAIKEKSKKFKF